MPQREHKHDKANAIAQKADQRRARDDRQGRKRCAKGQRQRKIDGTRAFFDRFESAWDSRRLRFLISESVLVKEAGMDGSRSFDGFAGAASGCG